MFGINYIKIPPSHYVMQYSGGKLARAGAGLAFFYFKPSTSLVVIPVGSADVPFIFNEISGDFQALTIQGQLTYRIQDPKKLAQLLNYTVNGAPEKYLSDDPQKLPQRLINLLQVQVRAEIQRLHLREVLYASEQVANSVFGKFAGSESLTTLGVELLALSIQAIKPIPEMARALEAEAREELLRRADQAIYDRRNSAVEQERRIKENELSTEIAVEEKKRQIREAKVNADLAVELKEQQVRQSKLNGSIALETERKKLVAAHTENARAEADVQAYAVEASLKAFKGLDPAVLQMLAVQSTDPRLMAGLALKEMAQNAAKIGNLHISPDLLQTLMESRDAKSDGK
ncbi:MAG: membrane protease subunit, stomatin/prohibitin [Chloroflexi bacterium HGW-Chloroflexi-6]|nr:MAG: membrane protease subunit, stomatin/prohibitin [Chloroflexi bacterium HGW-Chloroflexi-6]